MGWPANAAAKSTVPLKNPRGDWHKYFAHARASWLIALTVQEILDEHIAKKLV